MNAASNDALEDPGRALEEAFFRDVDQDLIAKFFDDAAADERRASLISHTGLPDTPLIDELLERDFSEASLSALMLLPAVLVAWADGTMAPEERRTVLQAAAEKNLGEDALKLLESWIDRQPGGNLWSLWQEYAGAVYDKIGAEAAGQLADEILDLATKVAKASGGIFGRMSISAEEQVILDEIKLIR
ncbi:MAG: hypothetical protein AAFU85_14565 [Planctomycetota bacterium]